MIEHKFNYILPKFTHRLSIKDYISVMRKTPLTGEPDSFTKEALRRYLLINHRVELYVWEDTVFAN